MIEIAVDVYWPNDRQNSRPNTNLVDNSQLLTVSVGSFFQIENVYKYARMFKELTPKERKKYEDKSENLKEEYYKKLNEF